MKTMDEFENIYKENYNRLYTLAFRMTGNGNDAEDVLQNAFMNAYRAFDDFKNQSSVNTWLYRIVINEVKKHSIYTDKLPVDQFVEEHKISSTEVFNYINSFGQVEDEVMTNLARETCLQFFMNCMPVKYRLAFVLRVILQFTVRETAEILKITENTVKVNLHRARMLLKKIAEGRCSLINSKNPCRCRAWAKYAIEKDKKIFLGNEGSYSKEFIFIQQKEKDATKEFGNEIEEIEKIVQLYNTLIISGSREPFMEKIKEVIEKQNLKILGKN